MLKMNYWTDSWNLHETSAPATSIATTGSSSKKLKNKLIYHFGTGLHHVLGIKQATNKSGNTVFAITASKEEYDSYVDLATTKAQISKSYLTYFGDIYLSNPKLLPDFDVVTMFHLCEFFFPNTASKAYGGMDDAKLLDMFTAKTKPGGYILFYTKSMAFHKAEPIIAKWEKKGKVKRDRRVQDAAGVPEEEVTNRHHALLCSKAWTAASSAGMTFERPAQPTGNTSRRA